MYHAPFTKYGSVSGVGVTRLTFRRKFLAIFFPVPDAFFVGDHALVLLLMEGRQEFINTLMIAFPQQIGVMVTDELGRNHHALDCGVCDSALFLVGSVVDDAHFDERVFCESGGCVH